MSKASGIFINLLLFLPMHDYYIFPYACVDVISIAMLKLFRVAPPLLAGLESYYNLVDMLSYAKIKYFSKTRF